MTHRLALILIFLIVPRQSLLGREADETQSTPAAMAEAANKLLASFDDEQRAKAVLPYNDPRRLDWHNIPKPERKGVPLSDMTDEQQKLCHALLKAALSDSGYDK